MARPMTATAIVSAMAAALAFSLSSGAFLTGPSVQRIPSKALGTAGIRSFGSTSEPGLRPAGEPEAHPLAAFVLAAALGLTAGYLIPGSKSALAVPRALPDFSLTYPESMKGVDAANAATKPGQFDYVMRSRIEASQFRKARQELVREQEQLRSIPSKAERVQRAQGQLEELAKTEKALA